MITCIIIEDETRFSNTLIEYIDKISKLKLLGVFKTVKDAIVNIEKLNPNLVFLDIELKDGQSFEILNHFPDKNFQIVFTTGHNEYALNAIKHSAIDYLLKPIDEEEFNEAVEKALKFHGNNQNAKKLELMLSSLSNNKFSKIAIHSIDEIEFIDKNDIVYCVADVSYTVLHLENGKKIVATSNIKKIQDLLLEKKFYRVHKSFIINLEHIQKVIKNEGGSVLLSNGKQIPIARRRKDELMTLLGL